MRRSRLSGIWIGFAMGGLCGVAAIAGVLLSRPTNAVLEIPVQASATRTDTMAAATGDIDSSADGLFTLDFLTGDLQCYVINTRNQQAAPSVFRANAMGDLQIDPTSKPQFMLLVGKAMFQGGRTVNARPANSVVYVIDSTSGNFVGYGIPWQENQASRGAPQSGALIPITRGSARNAMIREP
ncbi:hypothetical protein [Blastopirellula retiformator]|uniref:Uncharacterized protein n=1 Tax=Blastopirellula retiformator TaxID=2527970 RepID=A0A5C5V576_9BACT|nr:hypothetical protein [Blastopirellula retiformator]TWT33230.1 hypothetical protein Enr8_30550 [Blastopirellula retiformator]